MNITQQDRQNWETTDLFQASARARATDPATSHEAAIDVERSGIAQTQRRECLRIIQKHPGRTSAEIAALGGFNRHMPARRLPDLRKAGIVYNGSSRICKERGTKALVWYAH